MSRRTVLKLTPTEAAFIVAIRKLAAGLALRRRAGETDTETADAIAAALPGLLAILEWTDDPSFTLAYVGDFIAEEVVRLSRG